MPDLSGITTEPIALFHGAALGIYNLAQTFAIYQAVCYQEFRTNNISVDCNNLEEHKDVQNLVQEKSARWGIYLTLALFLPVLIADIVLGKNFFNPLPHRGFYSIPVCPSVPSFFFFFLPTLHHEFVIDWSEIFTEASFGDPNESKPWTA